MANAMHVMYQCTILVPTCTEKLDTIFVNSNNEFRDSTSKDLV